jgi:hypothetical protein
MRRKTIELEEIAGFGHLVKGGRQADARIDKIASNSGAVWKP